MCSLTLTAGRYDHDVQEDHDGAVTALASCERLKLFATSGDEGTIRVWTSKNLLIRYKNRT